MAGRIFIVVLAISLVVGEEGAAPSPLHSNGPNEGTEPIKQAQMEGLHEVLQEPWTPLEKSYSTSEETGDQKEKLLDSLSLSPSLVVSTREDSLSSGFPGLASVEDTVNAMEAESQLGDIAIDTGTVVPTINLVGAGLARVLQQELSGLTEDDLLHIIGPDLQDDLDRMSYEAIMDALAEKVQELEEEAEAQLSPEERAAWEKAKKGDEERETESEEDRKEEPEEEIPGEVVIWYKVERGEMVEKKRKETASPDKGNQDWIGWSVDLIPAYPSVYEKERAAERLKEWEKWAKKLRLLEEAEQEEEEVWSCRLRLIPTFFACLLIVAMLIIVTHQCFIEKRWKRRASVEEPAPVLLPKEPVPPVLVIVPQQKGKQLLY